MKFKLLILFVVFFGVSQIFAQVLAKPAPAVDSPTQGQNNDTVFLNVGPNDPTLDPAHALDPDSFFLVQQLFMGLVRVDEETGDIIPDLAKGMTVSSNATVFTFTLRDNVVWSDGTPVTAEDVAYSIGRVINTGTNTPLRFKFSLIEGVAHYWEGVISFEEFMGAGGMIVLDPTHIQFRLVEPASYFPHHLAHTAALTVPKSAIEQFGSAWTGPGNIVSSGPYSLFSWDHGVSLVLKKFGDHYNAENHQIEWAHISILDEADAWDRFQNGQLHSTIVPAQDWRNAQQDPQLSGMLHAAANHCTVIYGFNVGKPPFNDVRIRRAFAAALDKEGIASIPTGELRQAAPSYTPPGVFGHDPATGIPYDVDRGRLLLAEAGFPGGEGFPPVNLVIAESPENEDIADYASQNWKKNLGVNVVPVGMPRQDFFQLLNSDPPPIWGLKICSDILNAYDYLFVQLFFRSFYFGPWDNSIFITSLEQAARSNFIDDQRFWYFTAEGRLLSEDTVMLPLYNPVSGYATVPNLQRTYGNGEWGSRIADWQLGPPQPPADKLVYLPILMFKPGSKQQAGGQAALR